MNKQQHIINIIKEALKVSNQVKSCLLIGSHGRGTASIDSDIDFQVLLENGQKAEDICSYLREELKEYLMYFTYLSDCNKLALYCFDSFLLIEIHFYHKDEDVLKYFLGSEIKEVSSTVLFDKSNYLQNYLLKENEAYQNEAHNRFKQALNKSFNEFAYKFESASLAHARSDGYKFYFLYNLALHTVMQLDYYSKGGKEFQYLPKNLLDEFHFGRSFKHLNASTYLREANDLKENLLREFEMVARLNNYKYKMNWDIAPVLAFCNQVLERDFVWNFRDASVFNPSLKTNLVFRASSPTAVTNHKKLNKILREKEIKQIIDLRNEREVMEKSYSNDLKRGIAYFNIKLGNQANARLDNPLYNHGTKREMMYQHFAIDCQHQIRRMLELLSNGKKTLIHCVAGCDRTGVIISILHLLTKSSFEVLKQDYEYSSRALNMKDLNLFLEIVEIKGGIEKFLLDYCEISSEVIEKVKYSMLAKLE